MARKARLKLAVTVIALLSLAAVDLVGDVVAYPFCAADLQVSHSLPGDGDTDEPVHIDDCFCCSRCVNYSTPFAFEPVGSVISNEFSPPLAPTLLLPHQLYRPPRRS